VQYHLFRESPRRRVWTGGSTPVRFSFSVFVVIYAICTHAWGQGEPPPGPPPQRPPEQPLPPVPFPAENPITSEKALLGKILFWDEQLSADDTTACGSCHIPTAGGSDPRATRPESLHPGLDGNFGTPDDVRGSKGLVSLSLTGEVLDDGVFYPERQVTGRRSMTVINAGFSPEVFWDGRARGPFIDPETGEIAIPVGGALEIQALGPILSSVEMSAEGRTWNDVTSKLASASPLAFARDLPQDVATTIEALPSYPALFEHAFGSPEITARRVAFAIATYERTLVANQTPYDDFARGNPNALTADQRAGLARMRQVCGPCHNGPDFSNHSFQNTGVRPIAEDIGRRAVTGNRRDRGRFKTPGLRNVARRGPYFHNGGAEKLSDVIDFYNRGGDFAQNVAPQIRPLGLTLNQRRQIEEFLAIGLTDPRVDRGLPPFDHPTLRPHFRRGDSNRDGTLDLSDVLFLLGSIFFSEAELLCPDAADANDDGLVDVSDSIKILTRVFLGDAPLPYPSDMSTGPDLTEDALHCQASPNFSG
jgi:cytochrome c peroxidase